MRARVLAVVMLAGALTVIAPATAAGSSITGVFLGGTGPDNLAANGGGNIQQVFGAAAAAWQLLLLDNVNVVIDYGWQDNLGPLAATFAGLPHGSIAVQTGSYWFLDLTPGAHTEYATSQTSYATFGPTVLNYGTGFTGGTGAAAGFDLYSILLHEIGHVLSFGPNAFADWTSDFDADVTGPASYAGISLPVPTGCCHLGLPSGYTGTAPLLFPFLDTGERRLISEADLLFVAQGGGWTQLNTSQLAAVPEPGTLSLLTLGVAAVLLRRRRRCS
jgi:hypothetical protein